MSGTGGFKKEEDVKMQKKDAEDVKKQKGVK